MVQPKQSIYFSRETNPPNPRWIPSPSSERFIQPITDTFSPSMQSLKHNIPGDIDTFLFDGDPSAQHSKNARRDPDVTLGEFLEWVLWRLLAGLATIVITAIVHPRLVELLVANPSQNMVAAVILFNLDLFAYVSLMLCLLNPRSPGWITIRSLLGYLDHKIPRQCCNTLKDVVPQVNPHCIHCGSSTALANPVSQPTFDFKHFIPEASSTPRLSHTECLAQPINHPPRSPLSNVSAEREKESNREYHCDTPDFTVLTPLNPTPDNTFSQPVENGDCMQEPANQKASSQTIDRPTPMDGSAPTTVAEGGPKEPKGLKAGDIDETTSAPTTGSHLKDLLFADRQRLFDILSKVRPPVFSKELEEDATCPEIATDTLSSSNDSQPVPPPDIDQKAVHVEKETTPTCPSDFNVPPAEAPLKPEGNTQDATAQAGLSVGDPSPTSKEESGSAPEAAEPPTSGGPVSPKVSTPPAGSTPPGFAFTFKMKSSAPESSEPSGVQDASKQSSTSSINVPATPSPQQPGHFKLSALSPVFRPDVKATPPTGKYDYRQDPTLIAALKSAPLPAPQQARPSTTCTAPAEDKAIPSLPSFGLRGSIHAPPSIPKPTVTPTLPPVARPAATAAPKKLFDPVIARPTKPLRGTPLTPKLPPKPAVDVGKESELESKPSMAPCPNRPAAIHAPSATAITKEPAQISPGISGSIWAPKTLPASPDVLSNARSPAQQTAPGLGGSKWATSTTTTADKQTSSHTSAGCNGSIWATKTQPSSLKGAEEAGAKISGSQHVIGSFGSAQVAKNHPSTLKGTGAGVETDIPYTPTQSQSAGSLPTTKALPLSTSGTSGTPKAMDVRPTSSGLAGSISTKESPPASLDEATPITEQTAKPNISVQISVESKHISSSFSTQPTIANEIPDGQIVPKPKAEKKSIFNAESPQGSFVKKPVKQSTMVPGSVSSTGNSATNFPATRTFKFNFDSRASSSSLSANDAFEIQVPGSKCIPSKKPFNTSNKGPSTSSIFTSSHIEGFLDPYLSTPVSPGRLKISGAPSNPQQEERRIEPQISITPPFMGKSSLQVGIDEEGNTNAADAEKAAAPHISSPDPNEHFQSNAAAMKSSNDTASITSSIHKSAAFQSLMRNVLAPCRDGQRKQLLDEKFTEYEIEDALEGVEASMWAPHRGPKAAFTVGRVEPPSGGKVGIWRSRSIALKKAASLENWRNRHVPEAVEK